MDQVDRNKLILRSNIREIPSDVIVEGEFNRSDYPSYSEDYIQVLCPICMESRNITVYTLDRTKRTACVECVKFINNNTIWYGDRFGKLTVVGFDGIYNRNRRYICECDCGEVTTIWASSLHRGAESCGCAIKRYCGRDHPNWRGDDYPRSELYVLRRLKEYKKSRKEWHDLSHECQRCGCESDINAHHLWHVSTYLEKACDFSQVVPLCGECHSEFHKGFPAGNHYPCTPGDYYEWIREEGKEMYDWDWSDLFGNEPEPGNEKHSWDWKEWFEDMGAVDDDE